MSACGVEEADVALRKAGIFLNFLMNLPVKRASRDALGNFTITRADVTLRKRCDYGRFSRFVEIEI